MTTLLITATHDLHVILIHCTGTKRQVLCRKICANIDSKELHVELPIHPKHSRHECTSDRPRHTNKRHCHLHEAFEDAAQTQRCKSADRKLPQQAILKTRSPSPSFRRISHIHLPTTSMSPRSCSAAQPPPGDQQALRIKT